jgi:hypothetical protein
MKKTKLQKLMAIKKNLENRLTKINTESHRIQGILLVNNPFFRQIEIALNNGWASNDEEKNHWLELLTEAKDGNEDSLILLRAEFKPNESFKKETGGFKNV